MQEPTERRLGYNFKTFYKNGRSIMKRVWDCSYEVDLIDSLQALMNNKKCITSKYQLIHYKFFLNYIIKMVL